MAIKYNDRLLSAADRDKVTQYSNSWKNATTQAEKDDYHNKAEAVRAQYGYSGGGDGSQYLSMNSGNPNSLRGSTQLGNIYGIDFDENSILNKFNNATKAEYEMLNKEYQNTENKYYDRLADTQLTALDTIRRANSQSVATGASRGMQAANELSTMMGLAQTAVDDSTQLAQDRNALKDKEAAAYAKNATEAMTTANALKQGLANIDSQLYASDVQYSAADLALLGQQGYNEAYAQAALYGKEGQMYAADKNKEGQIYTADSNERASKYNTDGNLKGTMYSVDNQKSYSYGGYSGGKGYSSNYSGGSGSSGNVAKDAAETSKTIGQQMDTYVKGGNEEDFITLLVQTQGVSRKEAQKIYKEKRNAYANNKVDVGPGGTVVNTNNKNGTSASANKEKEANRVKYGIAATNAELYSLYGILV